MDKELLYRKLNDILDCMENTEFRGAKIQLEGLIKEIQYGIYDK